MLALAGCASDAAADRALSRSSSGKEIKALVALQAMDLGVSVCLALLLWNPRINVRLGLHFLKRLLKRYRGRVDLALSYYNGGSAVGDLPNARVIPATYAYVAKVRKLQKYYDRHWYKEII
jgi:hypothetical protein